jgi:hypothetical protein
MIELSAGLETRVVAAGVVAMLGMAVWLLFRRETNGEQSLFLNMMAPDPLLKGIPQRTLSKFSPMVLKH